MTDLQDQQQMPAKAACALPECHAVAALIAYTGKLSISNGAATKDAH